MTTSAITHPVASAAIAAWDDALTGIEDQQAWVTSARGQMVGAGMVLNGIEAVRVARPNIIEAASCRHDQEVVSAVGSALTSACDAALADPTLGALCLGDWLTGPAASFLEIEPGYPEQIVAGRFDGARNDDGLAILEFNGGLPGGIMPTQTAAAVMQTWSPFADLEATFDVTIPDLGAAFVKTLIQTWQQFGGTGNPRVVYAVPTEILAHYAVPLAYFESIATAAGLDVATAEPGELRHENGALWLAGRRVDVVVRVFFTSMLATLGPRIEALMSAVRAGDVCMITSVRAGLLGIKSLFDPITDPDIELDLDPATLALARKHLPWTRVLREGVTGLPDGSRMALDRFIEIGQDQLVLKPAGGTGGAGVSLGWECEPEQWAAAIKAARASGEVWIVQQRLALGSEEYPALAPGFARARYVADHNPVVLGGDVAGYFVRLSSAGGITNVTSGAGSVVPTFFVAEHA